MKGKISGVGVAVILVVLVAASVALTVGLLSGGAESSPAPVRPDKVAESSVPEVQQRKPLLGRRTKKSRATRESVKAADKKRPRQAVAVEDDYSPEDRKLADAVQEALSDDDFKRTREAARQALQSENPEVRREAVDALGWFGDKALVDLTKAMGDKDPDVAETARTQTEQALTGMEDSHMAFVTAAEFAKTFGEDPEATTMFLGIMDMTATQFIDPDDADSAEDVARAKARRADVVTALSDMIAQGGKTAESAKETYQSIVGEEWSGSAAANAWANDIADPEPDEPDPGEE